MEHWNYFNEQVALGQNNHNSLKAISDAEKRLNDSAHTGKPVEDDLKGAAQDLRESTKALKDVAQHIASNATNITVLGAA